MDTYSAFKLFKEPLKAIATVFQYTGQYLTDKSKTRYKVPALYVEFSSEPQQVNFGRIRCYSTQVKLHYISQAPFNATDNQIQDSAMQAHSAKVLQLRNLIEGMEIKDTSGRLVIGQCLITGMSPVSYQDTIAAQVLNLETKLYDYSKAYVKKGHHLR